jgi:hypothetical protein
MENMSTKQKLKDMNTKQKFEFIWDYYRFHIIGTIIIIAIVTSFTIDIIKSKETILNITALGEYMDMDRKEILENKVNAELIKDEQNKKQILFDFLVKQKDMRDEYSMASVQKLQASIAAKDVDVLILDKSDFEIYASQGTFMKLSQLSNFAQLNIPEKDLVKYQAKDIDSKEEIYGINAESLPVLEELKYNSKDKILCIVVNTQRLDKVSEFLNWFLAQNSLS